MLSSPRLRHARRLSVMFVGLLLVIGNQSASPPAAVAAPSCSAFTTKVYDLVNPATAGQALTTSTASVLAYQAVGFTANRPATRTAATKASSSVAGVHRLYRAVNKNFFYSLNAAEIARAVRYLGYVDQGIAFYAGTSSASCLTPVWSHHHPRGLHRFVSTAAESQALTAAGWKKEITQVLPREVRGLEYLHAGDHSGHPARGAFGWRHAIRPAHRLAGGQQVRTRHPLRQSHRRHRRLGHSVSRAVRPGQSCPGAAEGQDPFLRHPR